MRRRESYLYLMDQAECSARLAQCLQEMTRTSSTNIAWPNQLLTTVCSSLAVNLAHQCVLDAQPCHSSWAARHQAQLTTALSLVPAGREFEPQPAIPDARNVPTLSAIWLIIIKLNEAKSLNGRYKKLN